MVGNKAINTACNALYNTYLSDINACLKVVPAALFKIARAAGGGFGFDSEVVARLLRRGVRIHEVPIRYNARLTPGGQEDQGARRPADPPRPGPLPGRRRRGLIPGSSVGGRDLTPAHT